LFSSGKERQEGQTVSQNQASKQQERPKEISKPTCNKIVHLLCNHLFVACKPSASRFCFRLEPGFLLVATGAAFKLVQLFLRLLFLVMSVNANTSTSNAYTRSNLCADLVHTRMLWINFGLMTLVLPETSQQNNTEKENQSMRSIVDLLSSRSEPDDISMIFFAQV
jgi:hypothetical protein